RQGAPVKASGESDDRRAARMEARDLDCVLDCLRSGGQKNGLLRGRARCDLVELLGERHVALIWRDLEAGMSQLLELRSHRSLHFRMHMAGIEHGNAAGEVDIAPALHVPELCVGG